MNTEDGPLSFGTIVDTSGLDEGINKIETKIAEAGAKAEAESRRISSLLTNIPTVNIDVVTNASQSLSTISSAYAEIDRVVDSNQIAIKELEAEYRRLGALAVEAYKKGTAEGDKEFATLQRQQSAINGVINERKKVITAAAQQADELLKVEQQMQKEAESAAKAQTAHSSFRAELMKARNEMRQMIAQGQQSTEQYEQIRQKVVSLTMAMNAANKQTKVLSSPTQQFQGVISGLSGVTGAYSVATGAVSLFAGENADLQKIMANVQALMTITMGLQQIQTTLNKNSAFSQVTLNGLKEWWNKLLLAGAGAQAEETATTVANTAAQGANTAATIANTAAQTANNAAAKAGTAATEANTAGQVINTGAATAGTVANIGLAGAFRMVGAAIKSIPVFGWIITAIVAISAVVGHFIGKAREASKALEDHEKMLESGRKKYAEASMEIADYTRRIETFNGNKEQEKALVDELNTRYGKAFGYYDSLARWKDILKEKGEAYCKMLLKEAKAQAVLSKYTEAYVNLKTVEDKAAAGEYGHWYSTKAGIERSGKKAITDAQKELDKWKSEYEKLQSELADFKAENDLDFHIDPGIAKNKARGKGKEFDYRQAALEQKQTVDGFKNAVRQYVKDARDEITQATIDGMEDGLAKEINQIASDTYQKKQEWKNQLHSLAEAMKNSYKEYYMAQEEATEAGWSESSRGKMSIKEYEEELLQNEEIKKLYNDRMAQVEEQGQQQQAEVRQRYMDALIDEFGTSEQKMEKLTREWMQRIKFIPSEFRDAAIKQMDEAFASLDAEKFKASINWEAVFGDMDKQSLSSLQHNLDRVSQYFKENKSSMGGTEIKDFQEAISKMEDEIASRNPFTALAKSIRDIGKYKGELVAALNEYAVAQQEITAARREYNAALEHQQMLEEQISNGSLAEESEEYQNALNTTAEAQNKLNKATEKSGKAEQNVLRTRDNITASYKKFASQLESVNAVIEDVAGRASDLASVFSDDVAESIDKSIGFVTEMLDAASAVIDAIGDTGKNVASEMSGTAQAAGEAVKGTAKATATAISTVEKASVILSVISAALQVATAIANLFNHDDEKQEEIERLQRRIDQLQWELDNAEAVRLRANTGDALQKLKDILSGTQYEVLKLHNVTERFGSFWGNKIGKLIYQNEIYEKSIQKIADAYAKVQYTADKALGGDKYKEARTQLENLAEQQVLLQKQINEESSKKDVDNDKIEDWKRQIQEKAEEMATIINEMLEDIIGYTAEDLAGELGNAFFDAFKDGEDAAEAWGDKVNEIIADILKKMMIQELLEKPIGAIFDKYKTKWFGTDGNFKGFDAVQGSLIGFANELDALVQNLYNGMDSLPDELKDLLIDDVDVERQGTEKGIATASQESVDENNARLTTIQGHTYSINQGVIELNKTGNAMLEKLTGIEENTSKANDKLDAMNDNIRNIKSNVDDIQIKGLKLRT